MMNKLQKLLAPLLIVGLLFLGACGGSTSSSYDQVQQETTQNK